MNDRMVEDNAGERPARNLEWMRRHWQYLKGLNLFESIPPSTDHYELRLERISTRLFILLLTLLLTILLIYTAAVNVTRTITAPIPDLEQYQRLYDQYHQTLTCPCQQISINYRTFLNVSYTLHQVCSSYFVNDEWISFFINIPNVETLTINDFRLISIGSFQALKAFCELGMETISTNLAQFYSTNYVSAFVTPIDLFRSQSEVFVQQFISSSINSFSEALSLMRDTIQANALLAGHQQNYRMHRNSKSIFLASSSIMYGDGCMCIADTTCIIPSVINRSDLSPSVWVIPGFYAGCLATESLRQSNLECFYDENCLNELKFHLEFDRHSNISVLHQLTTSQYLPNTTIDDMVSQLMVDNWNWSIAYEHYYINCQPSKCIATILKKSDAVYIVTILISLFGGLTTALKLVIGRSLWFIKHWEQARSREQQQREYLRTILRYLYQLNLFKSTPPSTDPHTLRSQRISTRLFILLLTLLLTILLIYTAAVNVTRTITVPKPDLEQYQRLYDQYHQTLTCPCQQISINYRTFLNVSYTLHQVCSSYFISSEWLQFILESNPGTLLLVDFRVTGRQIFQALRALCELVKESILASLVEFYSSTYVTGTAIAQHAFVSEVEVFIQQFILSTTNNFALALKRIRDITQANGLASGLSTNYKYRIYNGSQDLTMVWATYDNNCSCGSSTACSSDSYIYVNRSMNVVWQVPGFVLGCFGMEALRQCHLECFYEQTCLNELLIKMNPNTVLAAPALDSSLSSRFPKFALLGTIVDLLMVENWTTFTNYDQYYVACKPIYCSYNKVTKNDNIYIITTLVGLIGGLVAALKLIIPPSIVILITCIEYWKKRRSTVHTGEH